MPTKKELVLRELEGLSNEAQQEVLDFVRFLKQKGIQGQWEPALLSEHTLAKDWLKPQEDEAWQDL